MARAGQLARKATVSFFPGASLEQWVIFAEQVGQVRSKSVGGAQNICQIRGQILISHL